MHRIISFVKVNLEEDNFEVLLLDFMNNLVEHKDSIQNIPTLNEIGLVRMSNQRSEEGFPIGVPLGEDLEYHIDNSDRPELPISEAPGTLGISDIIP